jgi:hypothetical protein
LFKERAYWLFATAHRLGDLRRLVNSYGRAPDAVFPTGPYKYGGSYGTAVNMTLGPLAGGVNPEEKGCTTRTQ